LQIIIDSLLAGTTGLAGVKELEAVSFLQEEKNKFAIRRQTINFNTCFTVIKIEHELFKIEQYVASLKRKWVIT